MCGRILLLTIAGLLILSAPLAAVPWIVEPTALNVLTQLPGPDTVLNTFDDIFFLSSSYSGGSYVGPAGFVLTANVSVTSSVVGLGGNQWLYAWSITNNGTGPFVQYVDTGNGPNFLQGPPLFGTAGVDRIPGNGDDVVPEIEIDSRVAGPPIIGFWGGTWNPDVDPAEAQRFEPLTEIPEPSTWMLVGAGLLLAAVRGRRRWVSH